MNLAGDHEDLIQRVSREVESLGLKQVQVPIGIQLEKSKPIERPSDLAPLIEHTLLKPQATRKDIAALCNEAKRFQFRGVCVNPYFVEEARRHLVGSGCSVVTVVGFPLGANLTATKVKETELAITLGANEIDVVIALGALKSGDYEAVYEDTRAVVLAAGSIPVKAIIETGLLEEAEMIVASLLVMRAGASLVKSSTGFAFVKTSTGFSARGATIDDITLIRAVVGDRLGIKAAGGIHDFQMARAMVAAGATRLGCSASVAIVTEPPK